MTRYCRPHAVLLAAALLVLLPATAFAQWDTPNRAFHKDTAFKLDGKHQAVPCASCHINGVTKGTPQTCASCHWVRRQDDPYRTAPGQPVRAVPSHDVLVSRALESRGSHRHAAQPGAQGARLRKLPQEPGLHGRQRTVRDVPSEGLRRDHDAKSRGGRVLDAVHGVPQAVRRGVQPDAVQPQSVLPARGPARRPELRHVPRRRPLRGDAAGLHRLSSQQLRPHHQPQPRGRGLLHQLRRLPQADRFGVERRGGHRQSQLVLPAGRPARDRGLRDLPRGRPLRGHADRLHRLPSHELRPDDEPEPRGGGLFDRVRQLPPRQ